MLWATNSSGLLTSVSVSIHELNLSDPKKSHVGASGGGMNDRKVIGPGSKGSGLI
jgi:hypothetical protein